MSLQPFLDSDGRKVAEVINTELFPTHQYGTQTTIGTIEHLKNPSITEIKKYFDAYYVPNNMAIVLDSMRYSDDDPTVEASPYPRDMTGYREGDRLDVAHIFVKDPHEAPLKLSVQQEQGGPLADLGENVLGLFLGKDGLGCKDGA
mgnify:CR=1 FL=1